MKIAKYLNINNFIGGGKRLSELDVAKGIGIVLVVHGHSCGTMFEHVVIGSFHMPLFFFLSGIFLFSKEESFASFLKKKAKSLLFPCLVFGILLSTYSTLLDILKHNDLIPYGMRYVGLFINMRHGMFPGSLWFFPALFLVELMLYALHCISKKPSFMIAGSVVLLTLGFWINNYYGKGLPWSLDIALYCSIFTALGYTLKEHLWVSRPFWIYGVAMLVFSFSSYCNFTAAGTCVDLYSCVLGNYFLFILSALSGIFLVIGFAQKVCDNKFLQYYGQNSLLVYALQFVLLLLVNVALRWIPCEWLSGVLQTVLILLVLIPVMNLINARFKWMTGKF